MAEVFRWCLKWQPKRHPKYSKFQNYGLELVDVYRQHFNGVRGRGGSLNTTSPYLYSIHMFTVI